SGSLTEIIIDSIYHNEVNENSENKRIIQVIYQKCPNVKYIKHTFSNSNFKELEELLINCQYLSVLHIISIRSCWSNIFEILAKSSPTNLTNFTFSDSCVE